MKIDLTFAEVHTPLFLCGTNYGLKLSKTNGTRGELLLCYDREYGELLVKSSKGTAIIPTTNVVSMTPADGELTKKTEAKPEVVKGKPGRKPAQASSPMDHVHAGPGAGKVRD